MNVFFSKSDEMEKHKPNEIWQEPVERPEEAEKNRKDTVTWDEFIQNTTIHGVRYIFDRSLRIRRFEKAVSDRDEGGRGVFRRLLPLVF